MSEAAVHDRIEAVRRLATEKLAAPPPASSAARPRPPPRTAARAKLADAIANHTAAAQRVAATEAALKSTREQGYKAQGRLDAATAAVEKARVDQTAHMVAAALGRAGAVPQTPSAARAEAPQARIKLDIDRAIGEVDPHLFGNFA